MKKTIQTHIEKQHYVKVYIEEKNGLALKLLAKPACAYALGTYLLALPPLATAVVTLLAAMPVGGNAYLFAAAYKREEAAVSGAIALSTPLALVTLTVLLTLLPGRL